LADGANTYQKLHLRKLFPSDQAADDIDRKLVPATAVPMRTGLDRVVDIQALANRMGSALNQVKAIDGGGQSWRRSQHAQTLR
jgi:hypothetical protein